MLLSSLKIYVAWIIPGPTLALARIPSHRANFATWCIHLAFTMQKEPRWPTIDWLADALSRRAFG